MHNLILLEDETILRQELAEYLADIGYRVDAVPDLAQFILTYDPARHRIAIIDLGLPDGDGMDLIRNLRARGLRLGIVVLTARGAMSDKIEGLGDGADYYLAKTADLDELAATLAALTRRLGPPEVEECWVLERQPRRLLPPGLAPVQLSRQDVIVLSTLMANSGGMVSRQDIVEALGEDFLTYDQRRLDTQIRRLRSKVQEGAGVTLPIHTTRNVGYQFYAAAEVRF